MKGINDAHDALVDAAELEVDIAHPTHVDDAHRQHLHLPTAHREQSVAQHIGAGVDTENDTFGKCRFANFHAAKIRNKEECLKIIL